MIVLFFGVIIAVVAADLITKFTIDGILNTGISWGIGANLPWLWVVIVVVSLVLSVVLIVWVVRQLVRSKQRPWLWVLGMALFIGGVLGNALDRMVSHGAVHDFIDFVIFKNNLADIAITVGAVLVMLFILQEAFRAHR